MKYTYRLEYPHVMGYVYAMVYLHHTHVYHSQWKCPTLLLDSSRLLKHEQRIFQLLSLYV